MCRRGLSRMGWRSGALMLAGLAAGLVAALAANIPPAEGQVDPFLQGDARLAVVTFNIRYGTARDGENAWPQRRELLFGMLRDSGADLLGLQEALRFQLDEIAEAVPGYIEIGVGRDDGLEAGEYAAILYRTARLELLESGTFWFSETPEVPGSMHWGNRITRICTWARFRDRLDDGIFYLYNLHLDHESQPSRERSVELLAERMAARAHPDPVLVTGDFNAGEDNPAMGYLLGALISASGRDDAPPSPRLRDSFRVLMGPLSLLQAPCSTDKVAGVAFQT